MVKQTAGRDALTGFADEFAHLNDDILFGEVWSREDKLSLKMRSILTVTVLVSKGLIDSSFQYHMQTAKKNGVTKAEMGEILTHIAFYAGWPNAWAAFRVALEVYKDDEGKDGGMFGLGEPNDAYAQYFTGQSYLKPLTDPKETVFMANVTSGRGWYQEEGKEAVELHPGDVITIPREMKHWHGAAKDSWFSHIAIEVPGENTRNEWCEAVNDEEYGKLR